MLLLLGAESLLLILCLGRSTQISVPSMTSAMFSSRRNWMRAAFVALYVVLGVAALRGELVATVYAQSWLREEQQARALRREARVTALAPHAPIIDTIRNEQAVAAGAVVAAPPNRRAGATSTATCSYCGRGEHAPASCWYRNPTLAPERTREVWVARAKEMAAAKKATKVARAATKASAEAAAAAAAGPQGPQ